MATPTAKRASTPSQGADVDPRWLLKAIAVVVAVAAVLAYLSVCLLIYQGGWQLMLHPSTRIDATPSIPFQTIHFDAAATGQPRLTAWWIPAGTASPTILFLHDGNGSLSSSVRELELLHTANVNVFAIDYRGFGQSDPIHPSEATMALDAAAAWKYLTGVRHLPPASIVPCGEGLGAALAARLANDSPSEVRAILLDNPDPDAFARATTGPRYRWLPMRLLVRDRFDIAASIARVSQPKLLLADGPFGFDHTRVAANQALFRNAPSPKVSVTFDSKAVSPIPGFNPPTPAEAYVQAIQRFLDEYIPASIPGMPETK
jgi:pimeloyl-ACP methyl ester carboxylesterase